MDPSVEWRLNGCASVLKQFRATADAFVINFFIDDHWQNIVSHFENKCEPVHTHIKIPLCCSLLSSK